MSPERRYCYRCAVKRVEENALQMRSRRGKFFDKWKANTAAALRRM